MDLDIFLCPPEVGASKEKMPRWDKKSEHLEIVMCDVSRPEIATVEQDGRALSSKIFLRVPKLP
jgi:hypothetical protein